MLAGILLYALFQYALASLPPRPQLLALRSLSEAAVTRQMPADHEDRLNLNEASLDQLTALPGIGEKTAYAILALRDELGVFHYPEELLLIRGIGEKKLQAIYDLVCVEATE